jgi:hypothetical protein
MKIISGYIIKNEKYYLINIVLVFLLLLISGFGYFKNSIGDDISISVVFSIVVVIIMFMESKVLILNKKAIWFGVYFLILMLVNVIIFDFFRYQVFLGFILRFLTACIVLAAVRDDFITLYIKVLYLIAVTSLVTFVLMIFHIIPVNTLESIHFVIPSNIEYRLLMGEAFNIIRNTGPFWEPGAFGGYLILAFFFNVFLFNKKVSEKTNLIFIITILTTQSTTAYIAMIIIFIFQYLRLYKKNIIAVFIILLLVAGLISLMFSSPLIGGKIITQYEYFIKYLDGNILDWNSQRFLSTYTDLLYFLNNPVFGVGLNSDIRFNNQYYIDGAISTNGWMNFLVRWGVTGFVVYFAAYYKTIQKLINQYQAPSSVLIYFVIVLIFISSSEDYFYYSFFWALAIYGFIPMNNSAEKKLDLFLVNDSFHA